MSVENTNDLIKENAQLYRQLSVYQKQSPLVGVRFYGQGGFGIGLNQTINGLNRVALKGYGSKGIIDQAAWQRIQGTEEVQAGIGVRDDNVIKELGFEGVVAEEEVKNSNSFTDDEIMHLLSNSSLKQLKKMADNITHHFAARHFVEAAKLNKFQDKTKISLFEQKHLELFTKFKWELLNIHDLKLACDIQELDSERKTKEQLVEMLANLELKNSSDE